MVLCHVRLRGGAIVAAADAPSIIRLIGWPIYQPTMMDKATW